jgi:uncharacterized protein
MTRCFFVSDLHGKISRYEKLFELIRNEKPEILFIGGDILPNAFSKKKTNVNFDDFILDYLIPQFQKLKNELQSQFPKIFIIMGNDDPKIDEESVLKGEEAGLWQYIHKKKVTYGQYSINGYSNVPPTPFLLKDWEKYDVSRYVDPGCVPPTEGIRTVQIDPREIEHSTILDDIETLVKNDDLSHSIFLFHSPPHNTNLDRAALDGKMIDYVPLDVHVGSIAIKRFIEEKQPFLTLHGHIHESTRITGQWKEIIGRTYSFQAAHDGQELALIKFDLESIEEATRLLI